MAITLNGTTGIDTPAVTNNGAYTGDGISFADATPSNTLVTTTGGNVGIGTSSPASKLTVNGSIEAGGAGTSAISFTFGGQTTKTGMGCPADGTLALYAGTTTERMRIDSSGNVGVGTSSPAGAVNPNARVLNIYSSNTTTNPPELRLSGNAGSSISIAGGASASYVWEYYNVPMTFGTNNTERMRIDGSGNVSITQAAGKYTIDTSGGATTIANFGTVDFANASGMLIVNNHSTGHVTIWLCGGGFTSAIGSVGSTVGTFAYVSGIGGYRWTNNYGATAVFGFFFVRTRPTA